MGTIDRHKQKVNTMNIESIKEQAREFLGFDFENFADVVCEYEDEVTRIVKREIDPGHYCDYDLVVDQVMDSLFKDIGM